ncbi:MAG: PdxA family dehydrogenase [Bacillota bacterium]
MQQRPVVAITMGDPAGVGPEVIVKALSLREMYEQSVPVVIGDYGLISDTIANMRSAQSVHRIRDCSEAVATYDVIDLIDPTNVNSAYVTFDRLSRESAQAATDYLRVACDLASRGSVHAVVGGPTDGSLIQTLYGNDLLTVHIHGAFKIVYPTLSAPLHRVLTHISQERVELLIDSTLSICDRLGISDPRIAVLGVNPHPDRSPGVEETSAIIPAVEQAKGRGSRVFGPMNPDQAFSGLSCGKYDIGLAMYHDQGHFPMKMLKLVNPAWRDQWLATAGMRLIWGLPLLFTTVDHGAQFELAGRNESSALSLIEAVRLAVKIAKRSPRI